jgi:hypothetical protein
MNDFANAKQTNGFSVKLWRGERMCLVGMDVDDPEPDLVGFSIEVKSPSSPDFEPLRNRLAFSYDKPINEAVNGYRNYSSLEAPFQKFRWVHFPPDPSDGTYTYRVTKKHMPTDDGLKNGTTITLDIPLDAVIYDEFLDIGFARNFASSQAYNERYGGNKNIIPLQAKDGLKFQKVPGDVYEWLGFEAYELIINFLKEIAADANLALDFFAYDLNEPDIVGLLEQIGGRLRAIIDNSGDHKPATSAESQAAKRLRVSAGSENIKRMHFRNLQHHKVLIAKKNGVAFKVLFGSTNFSFRGIYIQANNALVLYAQDGADLFERVFERVFQNSAGFADDPLSTKWHLVHVSGKPEVHICFSPHADTGLSLNPLGAAIDQASSSVFFSIAFLYQTTKGPTREAVDRLIKKDVFSYGVSDKKGGLLVRKPDGTLGIANFNYLSGITPWPFRAEWSGGAKGVHEHHKFVVTDFSLPTAKVFTGSSNLSPSGEKGNGDNLVMIEDPRVATSYAIEALRVFDHLHFRTNMSDAFDDTDKAKAAKRLSGKSRRKTAAASSTASRRSSPSAVAKLMLQKPTAISGKPAWFIEFYKPGTQKERDRKLFSR